MVVTIIVFSLYIYSISYLSLQSTIASFWAHGQPPQPSQTDNPSSFASHAIQARRPRPPLPAEISKEIRRASRRPSFMFSTHVNYDSPSISHKSLGTHHHFEADPQDLFPNPPPPPRRSRGRQLSASSVLLPWEAWKKKNPKRATTDNYEAYKKRYFKTMHGVEITTEGPARQLPTPPLVIEVGAVFFVLIDCHLAFMTYFFVVPTPPLPTPLSLLV